MVGILITVIALLGIYIKLNNNCHKEDIKKIKRLSVEEIHEKTNDKIREDYMIEKAYNKGYRQGCDANTDYCQEIWNKIGYDKGYRQGVEDSKYTPRVGTDWDYGLED